MQSGMHQGNGQHFTRRGVTARSNKVGVLTGLAEPNLRDRARGSLVSIMDSKKGARGDTVPPFGHRRGRNETS